MSDPDTDSDQIDLIFKSIRQELAEIWTCSITVPPGWAPRAKFINSQVQRECLDCTQIDFSITWNTAGYLERQFQMFPPCAPPSAAQHREPLTKRTAEQNCAGRVMILDEMSFNGVRIRDRTKA